MILTIDRHQYNVIGKLDMRRWGYYAATASRNGVVGLYFAQRVGTCDVYAITIRNRSTRKPKYGVPKRVAERPIMDVAIVWNAGGCQLLATPLFTDATLGRSVALPIV
jgi:hypothetical protein